MARIDQLIGIGERMTVTNAGTGADGINGFYHGIIELIEEIHGFGNQLSAKFSAINGYDKKTLKEGIAVLKDLRRLVLYAGEYGC